MILAEPPKNLENVREKNVQVFGECGNFGLFVEVKLSLKHRTASVLSLHPNAQPSSSWEVFLWSFSQSIPRQASEIGSQACLLSWIFPKYSVGRVDLFSFHPPSSFFHPLAVRKSCSRSAFGSQSSRAELRKPTNILTC